MREEATKIKEVAEMQTEELTETITSETKRRVCSTLQTSDAAVARSTATEIRVDSKAQGYWERYWLRSDATWSKATWECRTSGGVAHPCEHVRWPILLLE